MKMTEAQQAAVNEIARNAFIADRFGKIKGDIVKANKPFIDKHEDAFREGVPAEFEYEGRIVRCKLTMTPSPKWATKEVVVVEDDRAQR